MHDALAVRVVQAGGDLPAPVHGEPHRHRGTAGDRVGQRPSGAQLHDQHGHRHPAHDLVAEVAGLDDVRRARHLDQGLGLPHEARDVLGVRRDLAVQQLDRHVLARPGVLAAVDRPEPPTAEPYVAQLVPIAQQHDNPPYPPYAEPGPRNPPGCWAQSFPGTPRKYTGSHAMA
ncbi:hypothetical protein GCM10010315_28980 [Streptomyces luteosporeus]|uniref:Uncharacterized protein n=1 Tax=Streptomyces luteosporeus TaxID=173856 RepID=A0ABN3TS35_9ACTN